MLSRDDIIELMQEAGWKKVGEGLWGNVHDGCMFLRALERFAKLVYEAGAAAERERVTRAAFAAAEKAIDTAITAEREACARVCDSWGMGPAEDAAFEIRARGTPPCPDCHGVGYDASGQTCGCQD
jgi:hypothetical protein